MSKYRIKYFTSGGFKASGYLTTHYIIHKDNQNNLCIFDNNKNIGDIEAIERLLLKQLGYLEEITIFDATLEVE